MKWLSFVSCSLLAAALLGGGAGCKGEKKTAEGEGGKKLSVKAPADTSVKQGENDRDRRRHHSVRSSTTPLN